MDFFSKFTQLFRKKEKNTAGTKEDNNSFMPYSKLSNIEEEQMVNAVAQWILRTKMETIAIIVLESLKPISSAGSQLVLFYIAPFLELFNIRGYRYAALFEKSENVEKLIKKIEEGSKK